MDTHSGPQMLTMDQGTQIHKEKGGGQETEKIWIPLK